MPVGFLGFYMKQIKVLILMIGLFKALESKSIVEESDAYVLRNGRGVFSLPLYTGWPDGGCIRPSIIPILRLIGLVH